MGTEGLLKSLKEHKVEFGNTFVYFASLDSLIKMKRAAGRPKDLDDLKYLRRLTQIKRIRLTL